MSTRADVARRALDEITKPTDVGELVSETDEGDGVSTLRFENTMLGYPDWYWTVSVAELEGEDPTVLEAELLPGDGALLAPDWVPWADRLDELNAAKAAADAERAAAGDDQDADDLDADDLDADDLDDDDDQDDDEEDEDDDEDDHSDDLDGDDGDDVYDGLDPESALSALPDGRVDEADQPEG